MLNAMMGLETKNNIMLGKGESQKTPSWRRDPIWFAPGGDIIPGVVDIGSCWYQQGRSVSDTSIRWLTPGLMGKISQYRVHQPEVSKPLKDPQSGVDCWLNRNVRLLSIAGAVLAVVHPEQYEAGLKILRKLQDSPASLREPQHIQAVLRTWCSPFSAFSIISNRETPQHRDQLGRLEWYDVLTTMGDYRHLDFERPRINAALRYNPGTVVALSGKVLAHRVGRSELGDRVCIAGYMRNDVACYLDIPPGHICDSDSVLRYNIKFQ